MEVNSIDNSDILMWYSSLMLVGSAEDQGYMLPIHITHLVCIVVCCFCNRCAPDQAVPEMQNGGGTGCTACVKYFEVG